MKRKEIQQIAKKIAKQEEILANPNLPLEDKQKAELEIFNICSKVHNLEDMEAIDEAVQDLLCKKS